MNSAFTEYTIFMENPSSHYFGVKIEVKSNEFKEGYADFILPVWRSGRYYIFDFASGIQNFYAADEANNKLKWIKINKNTWRVFYQDSSKLIVSYKVYANEFNLRTRGLNGIHAFINGSSVFMFVNELRNKPVSLAVFPFSNWKISTGLKQTNEDRNNFTADNYDILIDTPIEAGTQKEYEFNVEGKKHIISFTGEADYNVDKLIEDFSTIIKLNFKFWGKVPYDKYVFIVHCSPESGGGTEHLNSTVVGVKPDAFNTSRGYTSFLRLISHEFFHTWNVKQLKPAGLTPYDYTKENYTSELWIAEGGTSYYDGLMLLRCGLIDEMDFFDEIARYIEDERRRPGYRVQSVAESSFDAWVKFWRKNANAYYSESDYYKMGSYVCFILDLEIRNSSLSRYSLDDVFKTMFEKFPLDVKGYTNDDFREVCEEYAGIKLNVFFNDYVYGTKPIDWEKYLSYAGLNLVQKENINKPSAGFFPGGSDNNIYVAKVFPGKPADLAGIVKGDKIIACDGNICTYSEAEDKILSMKSGEKATFTVLRGNKLHNISIKLGDYFPITYNIEKMQNPTDNQKDVFEKWLNVKW